MSMEDAIFALAEAMNRNTEAMQQLSVVQMVKVSDTDMPPKKDPVVVPYVSTNTEPAPVGTTTSTTCVSPKEEDAAPEQDAAARRKDVRAKLDELGVEYNVRLGTAKLEALLAEQEDAPATDDELAPESEAPAIQTGDVIDALKAYSMFHGKEGGLKKVRGLLDGYGAKRVSDLAEDQFNQVVGSIKDELGDDFDYALTKVKEQARKELNDGE